MVAELAHANRTILDQVCREYHVQKLAVFGSVARGEARANSDIDLLVVYEPGFTPTLFDLATLSEVLRPLFGGRDVDLVRPDDLHWFIKNRVIQSAQAIYEG
ncbi:MAG: nucleotidyltransferase family protein [Tepidisphaeraceae bacterium]